MIHCSLYNNMYTHMYMYIVTHVHVHTYVHVHVHSYTCTYVHVHSYTCTCMCYCYNWITVSPSQTQLHTHTHTHRYYTHMQTQTHTHIPVLHVSQLFSDCQYLTRPRKTRMASCWRTHPGLVRPLSLNTTDTLLTCGIQRRLSEIQQASPTILRQPDRPSPLS